VHLREPAMMQVDGSVDRDFGKPGGGRTDFGEVGPAGEIPEQRRQQDALAQPAQRHGESDVVGRISRHGDVVFRPCHGMIERGTNTRHELGLRGSKACAVQAELERLGRVHREG